MKIIWIIQDLHQDIIDQDVNKGKENIEIYGVAKTLELTNRFCFAAGFLRDKFELNF